MNPIQNLFISDSIRYLLIITIYVLWGNSIQKKIPSDIKFQFSYLAAIFNILWYLSKKLWAVFFINILLIIIEFIILVITSVVFPYNQNDLQGNFGKSYFVISFGVNLLIHFVFNGMFGYKLYYIIYQRDYNTYLKS